MDVLEAVGKFGQSLIDIANSGPYGMLFVLLFLVGTYGVIAQLTALVRAIRNRARQGGEPDEDVTDPNVEMAQALSKISDALLVFANGFTPVLKDIRDTATNTEAGVAGIMAAAKQRQPIDTALLETDNVIVNSLERLQKSIANIRTKEEAQAHFDGINAHTDVAVKPIVDHSLAHSVAVGVIDQKLTLVDNKISTLPPQMDGLNVKVDGLHTKVDEIPKTYYSLVAERDDLKKALAQSLSDLMARDKAIEEQQVRITALTAERDSLLTAAATLEAAKSPDVKPEAQP